VQYYIYRFLVAEAGRGIIQPPQLPHEVEAKWSITRCGSPHNQIKHLTKSSGIPRGNSNNLSLELDRPKVRFTNRVKIRRIGAQR
jgi:hypothetical protein